MAAISESYVVSDLAQIKALADPLRHKILYAFVDQPRTTKQVATLLNEPATKLYHHVDLLDKLGFLRLVETRQKRGTTERYFQAIAKRFHISASQLGPAAATFVEEMFENVFEDAIEQVRKAVHEGVIKPEANPGRTLVSSQVLWLNDKERKLIIERLGNVDDEFNEERNEGADPYHLVMAFYPIVETPEEA